MNIFVFIISGAYSHNGKRGGEGINIRKKYKGWLPFLNLERDQALFDVRWYTDQ